MRWMRSVSVGVGVSLSLSACDHGHPPEAHEPARARAAVPSAAAASPVVPVPETLAFDAGRFGLTMVAEGWSWKVLRRNVTRFDWEGRPTGGDAEVLYSFWMDKIDDASKPHLARIVETAAANLTDGEPCRAFDQPPDIVKVLGFERVITVCFEPSTFYGKEHKLGVLHGIVNKGALTIVVVLSNDRSGLIPLPKAIGARGTPTP